MYAVAEGPGLETMTRCKRTCKISVAGGPGLGYRGHGAGPLVPLDVWCCSCCRQDPSYLDFEMQDKILFHC